MNKDKCNSRGLLIITLLYTYLMIINDHYKMEREENEKISKRKINLIMTVLLNQLIQPIVLITMFQPEHIQQIPFYPVP
jgi:hypothetical protein